MAKIILGTLVSVANMIRTVPFQVLLAVAVALVPLSGVSRSLDAYESGSLSSLDTGSALHLDHLGCAWFEFRVLTLIIF